MSLRKFNPTTPGVRFKTVSTFEELTKSTPEKRLTEPKHRTGGRNNFGRVTSRFRGGGHKQRYRIVDFTMRKDGVEGVVKAIEYDPNRTARIALIFYRDGDKRYVLAPEGIKVGDTIQAGIDLDHKMGNTMPLSEIMLGSQVYNIELKPGKGGQMCRAAGSFAQVLAKENGFAQLRLPSGEVRMVSLKCRATLGQVGNLDHKNISLGKAGKTRWLGKKPHNRGSVMNPVDHPHGGGEGKCPEGRNPCSPWGQLSKGLKTRKRNKPSSQYIVRSRNKK